MKAPQARRVGRAQQLAVDTDFLLRRDVESRCIKPPAVNRNAPLREHTPARASTLAMRSPANADFSELRFSPARDPACDLVGLGLVGLDLASLEFGALDLGVCLMGSPVARVGAPMLVCAHECTRLYGHGAGRSRGRRAS